MNIEAIRVELNRLLTLADGDRLMAPIVTYTVDEVKVERPALGSACACLGQTRDVTIERDLCASWAYKWCSAKTEEFNCLEPDPAWKGSYVSTPGVMTPRRRKFVEWLLVELEKEEV
jgi:hypothetical protein